MHSRTWRTPLPACLLACILAVTLMAARTTPASASPSSMSGVDDATVDYSGSAVVIAPGLTLSSGDDIDGAVVSIGSGLNDGGTDELDVSGTLPGGITASYDSDKGVLTLSGTASPADYQTALRSVTFSTTAALPGTSRRIICCIGKAIPDPDNGHFYLFVEDMTDWEALYSTTFASHYGRQGYLATITSADEGAFVAGKIGQEGWLGATCERAYTGSPDLYSWNWVTGPENGTKFFTHDGAPVDGQYNNWTSGQPGIWIHNSLRVLGTGGWTSRSWWLRLDGYHLEYGGMDGDDPVTISGTVTVELGAGTTLIGIRNVHKKNKSDQLCRIPDTETGALEIIGELGTGHTWAKGLAVLPGEDGDDDRIFAAEQGRLLEIDPQTGAAIVIGGIGWKDVTGLAFHPTTRELYGITYGTNKLLEIDIATGAGSVVASRVLNSSRLDDLAFHPDGDLYVIANDAPPRLFKISPTTGKKIARWNLTGALGLESLLWSEDGETLYSAAMRNGYKDLCTIDLDAGTVNFVSSTSSSMRDIEGLGWFHGELGSSNKVAADEEPEAVEDPDEPADAAAGEGEGEEDVEGAAARLQLLENIPNPFNPTTRIEYELPDASDVHLAVYDVAGRLVTTLASGRAAAGRHAATWSGRDAHGARVAAGLYFYSLRSGATVLTRRMVLLK